MLSCSLIAQPVTNAPSGAPLADPAAPAALADANPANAPAAKAPKKKSAPKKKK
jgi:hypothetical protein